jgi:hypothetical protein
MDTFTTRTLLRAIKEAGIRTDNFFLRMFFPEVYTFTTEKVDLDYIPNAPKIAPFCSPLVSGVIERNEGYHTTSFIPAYVKSKHNVTAQHTMKRLPGEDIGGTKSPKERQQACVMQNLSIEEKAIAMREEWMAAQMVLNGAYMVEGENIEKPYEVSAGRRPENNIKLIDAARWPQLDKVKYDVMQDIEDWADLADSGIDVMVLDKLAWSELRQFQSFKDAFETRRGSESKAELAFKDLGKAVSYKGQCGDLDIYVLSEEYTDRDGTTKKQMPDYTLILGHTANRGVRLYGAIQDLDAQNEGLDQGERYVKDWIEGRDPAIRQTKTESAPAPYMIDVNNFVVVTVG